MIEGYIRKRENLGCLFVLVDSRHEPQQIDFDFLNDLGKWEVAFAIVFTKTDKNKPGATERNVKAFLAGMKDHWEALPPYFTSSALSREGRDLILAFIDNLNREYSAMRL
jgi:GTP-binding protein